MKEKAGASLHYPEDWINGFIWYPQEASPSVGDVGVVGETVTGFRAILSSSAWTSDRTGFWPTLKEKEQD